MIVEGEWLLLVWAFVSVLLWTLCSGDSRFLGLAALTTILLNSSMPEAPILIEEIGIRKLKQLLFCNSKCAQTVAMSLANTLGLYALERSHILMDWAEVHIYPITISHRYLRPLRIWLLPNAWALLAHRHHVNTVLSKRNYHHWRVRTSGNFPNFTVAIIDFHRQSMFCSLNFLHLNGWFKLITRYFFFYLLTVVITIINLFTVIKYLLTLTIVTNWRLLPYDQPHRTDVLSCSYLDYRAHYRWLPSTPPRSPFLTQKSCQTGHFQG